MVDGLVDGSFDFFEGLVRNFFAATGKDDAEVGKFLRHNFIVLNDYGTKVENYLLRLSKFGFRDQIFDFFAVKAGGESVYGDGRWGDGQFLGSAFRCKKILVFSYIFAKKILVFSYIFGEKILVFSKIVVTLRVIFDI